MKRVFFASVLVSLFACVHLSEEKIDSCQDVIKTFYTSKAEGDIAFPPEKMPNVGFVIATLNPETDMARILCLYIDDPAVQAIGCKEPNDLTGKCKFEGLDRVLIYGETSIANETK